MSIFEMNPVDIVVCVAVNTSPPDTAAKCSTLKERTTIEPKFFAKFQRKIKKYRTIFLIFSFPSLVRIYRSALFSNSYFDFVLDFIF